MSFLPSSSLVIRYVHTIILKKKSSHKCVLLSAINLNGRDFKACLTLPVKSLKPETCLILVAYVLLLLGMSKGYLFIQQFYCVRIRGHCSLLEPHILHIYRSILILSTRPVTSIPPVDCFILWRLVQEAMYATGLALEYL